MTDAVRHPTRISSPSQAWIGVFPARPDRVRHMQQGLARLLDGCPLADSAVLCLSELATNSVIHSDSRLPGGVISIRADIRYGDYIRIEVRDGGGPWKQQPHTDTRPHGLDIVSSLAADCGVTGDESSGRIAWARLDW
jgi:hypothetical protein